MTIGTGDTRVRFIDSLDCIAPVSDSLDIKDANVDLGYSSIRFKDIYTSGGIYLGAASNSTPVAANYLDDYEEGSWTGSYNRYSYYRKRVVCKNRSICYSKCKIK